MVYTKGILSLAERSPVITPRMVSEALMISIGSARRALLHLYETGRIRRICKGYYTVYSDPKIIGTHLNYPSYISFLSALYYEGLTTQVPAKIQFATLHSWRAKRCLEALGIEYIKIPKRFFFGYKKKDNYYLADPEKAILDMIITNQNPEVHPIDWQKIDPEKLLDYAKASKKVLHKMFEHTKIATIISQRIK